MGKTVRIRDDQYQRISAIMKPEEDFADALERALTTQSQNITEQRPRWVQELKSEILREVKNALETALAR